MTTILGIESSCDETAAAVVRDGRAVLSNIIASQHELHRRYGGVVPEIASRAHLERISPVVAEALTGAGVKAEQIDAVAVGNRPGLIGSLLVGVSAAKAIAWALGKPIIGVDHVRAHLYAAVMEAKTGGEEAKGERRKAKDGGTESKVQSPKSKVGEQECRPAAETLDLGPWTLDRFFPALGLVVSGGHCSLYELASPREMRLLGKTIDDAVGEAYDKAAMILEIGYPGGPLLDKLAQDGNPASHALPRTLLEPESLNFSFSGLKTALLYKVRGFPKGRGAAAAFEHSASELSAAQKADLAAAFQEAAVDTLLIKIERALDLLASQGRPARSLLVGGGVSANSLLRRRAMELGPRRGLEVRVPPMALCMDNAAMIAGFAFEAFRSGQFDDLTLPAMATTDL